MTKTVKDILKEAHGIKYQGDIASELLRKLSIEITEAYEKELAEKDKEIEKLKQQQQLFKEDFYKNPYSTGSIDWILVDSSKYDKLPSKDLK